MSSFQISLIEGVNMHTDNKVEMINEQVKIQIEDCFTKHTCIASLKKSSQHDYMKGNFENIETLLESRDSNKPYKSSFNGYPAAFLPDLNTFVQKPSLMKIVSTSMEDDVVSFQDEVIAKKIPCFSNFAISEAPNNSESTLKFLEQIKKNQIKIIFVAGDIQYDDYFRKNHNEFENINFTDFIKHFDDDLLTNSSESSTLFDFYRRGGTYLIHLNKWPDEKKLTYQVNDLHILANIFSVLIRSKCKTLFHCRAGIGRSVEIMLATMLFHYFMNVVKPTANDFMKFFDQSLEMIKFVKPAAGQTIEQINQAVEIAEICSAYIKPNILSRTSSDKISNKSKFSSLMQFGLTANFSQSSLQPLTSESLQLSEENETEKLAKHFKTK